MSRSPEQREAYNAYMRAYRARNLEKERERERGREQYRRHGDAVRARVAEFRAANPERVREWKRAGKHRRRALLRGAKCSAASALAIAQLRRECSCGAAGAHLDHIVPVARGGCSHEHNLQWLCAACNLAKNDTMPPQYEGCPAVWKGTRWI